MNILHSASDLPSPQNTLVFKDDDVAFLMQASVNHSTTALEKLLHAGMDPNTLSKNLNTPLMNAAEAGQLSCVELLLQHGANVHLKNNAGATALDMAVLGSQNIDCVRLLLKNGSDPNTVNFYQLTPLLGAIIKQLCWVDLLENPLSHTRSWSCMMELINHGANVLAYPGPNAKIPVTCSAAEAIIENSQYFTDDLISVCQVCLDRHLLAQAVQEASASKNDPGRKTKL